MSIYKLCPELGQRRDFYDLDKKEGLIRFIYGSKKPILRGLPLERGAALETMGKKIA